MAAGKSAVAGSSAAANSAATGNSANSGSKWVLVRSGLHTLPATLKIPSGITLIGEGASTILFLDPASGARETMINASPDIHDVTIRNLVIEAANKMDPGYDPNTSRSVKGGYNRGGILFRAEKEGQMTQISLIDLTVRNGTYSGVSISGADRVSITRCDLSENGASVPPGPKLTHNLLLAHCSGVNISGSRLVTSPFGSGLSLDHCDSVSVTDCEIARNGYFGVLIAESRNVRLQSNLIEGNDASGVMAEYLYKGNDRIIIRDNSIRYNNGYGIETYATRNSEEVNNTLEGNGNHPIQQKISPKREYHSL